MAELDEEQQWVCRSRQGDHEAFEALIKRHQRMIHALAFRMTGSLADAEDLAQEVFIQAFRQLDSYRAEARFSSWLYRIAINLCLNWQARRARQQRLHDEWGQSLQNADAPSDRRAQLVQIALMKLHPKQRAAIALTVYEELSHAEAARILNCSETTVSWRVFTARAKLKKILSRAGSFSASHE
jgi:RNA polymerase sigma-70 factor, ECF subfamily